MLGTISLYSMAKLKDFGQFLVISLVTFTARVGPAIWGFQNREKRPQYFSKKGYFGHKTGPQKPGVKEFFDVEEQFNSKNGG